MTNTTIGTRLRCRVLLPAIVVLSVIAVPQQVTASSPPSNLVVVASTTSERQVDLSWSNVTTPAKPTGYRIVPLISGTAQTALIETVPNNDLATTSYSMDGLTNGTTYRFRVDAVYPGGVVASLVGTDDVIPYGLPDDPVAGTPVAGNSSVELSWTAPATNGRDISGYVITISPAPTAGQPAEVSGTSTSVTLTGLANGTEYSFVVAAKNLRGTGLASASVTQTPFTGPTKMSAPTVSAGDEKATVSWAAPSSDGGSAVKSYTITAASSSTGAVIPSAITLTVAELNGTLSKIVTGLTNDKVYTFTVVATNDRNAVSATSDSSSEVTPTSAPPASVSSSTPSYSAVNGGEKITFLGSNLTGATVSVVCFDLTTPTVATPTVTASLVSVTSPVCDAGSAEFKLNVGGVLVTTHNVIYRAKPAISSVSPTSVTAVGQELVTLTGTGLSTGVSTDTVVKVGTTAVTLTSVSDTSVTFRAPSLVTSATVGQRTLTLIVGSAASSLSITKQITYTKSTNAVVAGSTASRTYGTGTFSIAATSTAGSVTFRTTTSQVCSVQVRVVTILSAGLCVIEAATLGSSIYLAGSTEMSITINRASQSVSVDAPVSLRVAGKTETILASSSLGSSGGAISFESLSGATCSVTTAGEVKAISAGSCIVRVTTAQTTNYSSASAEVTMAVLEALAGATPETAPVPPVLSVQLTLGVKKSISNSSVIKSSKIIIPKGAKTSIVIAKASKSFCQIVGTSIRGLKKGSCQVTVTMTPKKGPKVAKTLTVKVS
jgi:hypothetical protein